VLAAPWHGRGLAVTPRTPRLTHPVPGEPGAAGCDVRGVNRRQAPTTSTRGDTTLITPSREARARQQRPLGAVGRRPRRAPQARGLAAWPPVLRGGRHACFTVGSHETFAPRDAQLRPQRRAWIRRRQPHKPLNGGDQPDWRGEAGPRPVTPPARGTRVRGHTVPPIRRHVPGPGRRRPYDGEAVSWGRRRAPPGVSRRGASLLKSQGGRCADGGDACHAGDVRDVDPRLPRPQRGREASTTWPLCHRDGHVAKTARERRRCA